MQEPRHAEHEEDTEQNDEREQTALLRRQMRTQIHARMVAAATSRNCVGFETSARLVAWAYPTTKLTSFRGTTIVFWIAWRSMCA